MSVFLYVLLFPCFLKAQQASDYTRDSIQGVYYYELADSLFADIDTSLYYAHLALPLLEKTKQWELYVLTRCGMNYCYNSREQYDSMENNNQIAFEIAIKYINPKREAFNCASSNLALNYSEINEDYLKALKLYKKNYHSVDKTVDNFVQGPLEENIGQMYYFLGDFETAIRYYTQAINTYKTYKPSAPIRLAKVYDKLSKVYYDLNQLTLAKKHQLTSIQTLHQAKKFDQHFDTRLQTELVKINIALDSLVIADRQLQQLQDIKNLTHLQQAKLLTHQGTIAFKKGDFSSAINYFTRGIEQNIKADKIRETSKVYRSLAQVYLTTENFNLALKYQQEAVRLLTQNASLKRNIDIPNSEAKVLSRLELFKVFIDKGRTLEQLYQQSEEKTYLIAALDSYTYLSSLTDDIRRLYQSKESHLLLLEEAKDFYEDAIAVAYNLYELTKDNSYLEKAFFFTEKSKSNLLLEELRKKKFIAKSLSSDTLIQQEYALRVAITSSEKLIAHEIAKGAKEEEQKLKNLKSTLFSQQQLLERVIDKIQESHPAYAELTKKNPIILQELQKKLNNKQVALEYFVGEQNIYLFKITATTTDFIKIPNDFDLNDLLTRLFDNLKMTGKNGLTDYTTVAYELFERLIQPAKLTSQQKELLIIPDGQLENLPIGILVANKDNSHSPKKLSYLIKEYTIGYAYSATIFDFQMKQIPSNKSGILGLFPVFRDSPKELLLSTSFHQSLSRFVGTYLLEKEATVRNFQQQAVNSSILHFFTHARGHDPQTGKPSIDFIDQTVALSDLQNYHLNADLATLSACQTNVGEYKKGEGIMSLSRMFTFAGIPSIITSVANVFEESTSTIIIALYNNLAQKMPKHEALRKAKQDYLNNPTIPDSQCAPYYWGTFLAIGNTKAIPLSKVPIMELGFYQFMNWSKNYLGYFLVLFIVSYCIKNRLSS